MNIQYAIGEPDNQNGLIYKQIAIDISDKNTIGDFISKLHEIIGLPMYREVTWGENTTKVSCVYYIQKKLGELSFIVLDKSRMNTKVSKFPKSGPNGELTIIINNSTGIVN
ncbi:hypothetical protein [uncultured Dokdonia sp.]|uniref:hypothetical protein n=1 Tax=uncultured Dokdonia sp. TaxID=575653 RepID=UPI00261666E2|nr:hypothetical protein [uncultured Dokdonia sp.]